MAQNLFEELQQRKQNLISMVEKARDFKWFDADDKENSRQADVLIKKINDDTLVIGVIGQMKCGKSTFLNAFVFEDDVLPAATTPMTAALSVITYGEEKKIEAEFYDASEWEEQKMQAERSTDGLGELEKSKVQAAQELVVKSQKLGSSLAQYLGRKQEDSFEHLEEYVGADGKFVSITKSVTIYYPKEYLKGVKIVDTPGFNDPIVSREERTKEFLQKADAVLMLLYAGRPFDATDRTILFEKVRQRGIGKVLIGINKYDICYEKGETEDEIKEYVKDQLQKASETCNGSLLKEILDDTEPIPLSAEMALLAQLAKEDMSKVSQNPSYKFAWNRYCNEIFDDCSNWKQLWEKSHIDNLTAAVKATIEKGKDEIIFAKGLSAVEGAGRKKLNDITKKLGDVGGTIKLYQTPAKELEEKKEILAKAVRRLNKKISMLADDLDNEFRNMVRSSKRDMEDAMAASCRKLNGIIDGWGPMESFDKIKPQLEDEINTLQTRTLKYLADDIAQNVKNKLCKTVQEFFDNSKSVFDNLSDEDIEDLNDAVYSIQQKINIDIQSEDVFKPVDSDKSEEGFGIGNVIEGFVAGFLGGFIGAGIYFGVKRFLKHDSTVKEMKTTINQMKASFDPEPYLNGIMVGKDRIIEDVKKELMTELLLKLQTQYDSVEKDFGDKTKALSEAEHTMEFLTAEKANMVKQMAELGIENK